MQNKTNIKSIQLKNWLWNKPIFFALSFFITTIIISLIYAGISMTLNIETATPMLILMLLTFIGCTYYTIKKLSHDKINQNDFVAITNGATLISVISSFVLMIGIYLFGTSLKAHLMLFYITHKMLFITLFILFGLFSLYLIGVAISGIYAKYKRSESIGIDKWKIILSMPFTFLLMWTPGYLLKGKDIKNNLQIKCQWYSRLQKWVMTNSSNILFMFLFLVLCKGIIAGLPTFILSLCLLIIYTLWYTKHKSEFIKDINNGYAMTAVGINIAILIAVIVGILGK